MEHVFAILHKISPVILFDQVGMMSSTDIVVAFLASKAAFAACTMAVVCTPLRHKAAAALSGPDTSPERLLGPSGL